MATQGMVLAKIGYINCISSVAPYWVLRIMCMEAVPCPKHSAFARCPDEY